MSKVYVFPGQGSQFVGMGKELYKNYKIAKDVFDEVDDALNQKLSELIFNGPIEELTLTSNVQPAIMATSIAMYRVANLETPNFVAGHSLGEYTALCATNSISLKNTAILLRIRGNSMQKAVPIGTGAMAVILGLEYEILKEICIDAEKRIGNNSVCDIANDNSPGQIVISGSKEAIELAMNISKEKGAKRAMLLPLSVSPHSKLMEPVKKEMSEALNNIEIKKPICPLISNKTCNPIENVEEIKEALLYQITHGVRWRESVLNMSKLGITESFEIGPGNVLTGLINKTNSNIKTNKIEL